MNVFEPVVAKLPDLFSNEVNLTSCKESVVAMELLNVL